MSFESLGLDSSILQAVKELGYENPTEVQAQAIPIVLSGKDVFASAQTGTGKTAAFVLPALQFITQALALELPKTTDEKPKGIRSKGPRVLVLAPTRELAMQVSEAARSYSQYLNKLNVVSIVGGIPYFRQREKLKRHIDLMVATPGRLIDYLNQGSIDFSRVELVVLDEADRMLELGMREAVQEIFAALPEKHQTLMFSATLPASVRTLAAGILKNPVHLEITPPRTKHENIEQTIHYVRSQSDKDKLLTELIAKAEVKQAIIFAATKRSAESLSRRLEQQGFSTDALHGDKRQRERTRAINAMQDGEIQLLVATDVAARGIDVKGLSHIFNFDLPRTGEDYTHRIGRTGRAGAAGTAITFALVSERRRVREIERIAGYQINAIEVPGMKEGEGERSQRSDRRSPRDSKRGPRRSSGARHDRSGGGRGFDRQGSGRNGSDRVESDRTQRLFGPTENKRRHGSLGETQSSEARPERVERNWNKEGAIARPRRNDDRSGSTNSDRNSGQAARGARSGSRGNGRFNSERRSGPKRFSSDRRSRQPQARY